MKESSDGKTAYLVVAHSISLYTRFALYLVDKTGAKPVAPEIDAKGRLKNRNVLEQVLKKPQYVLVKDFSMVGNCGFDVKVLSLEVSDSMLLIHAATDTSLPSHKACGEFIFKFDLNSKKWIENKK